MVNWKMKNIFIYADIEISSENLSNNMANYYKITPNNLITPNTNIAENNFLIIDTDNINDINLLISKYKKFNTKIYAYTKNTSKDNILNLYSLGVDNVIFNNNDANNVIKNIINDKKLPLPIKNIKDSCTTQKSLILSDNKVNLNLLLKTLENFNFEQTIKYSSNEVIKTATKNQYDLIIIDTKTSSVEITKTVNKIIKSKTNRNTPIIILSDSLSTINELYNKSTNLTCIEKPYNPDIFKTQLKNIIQIKKLQDELKIENNLLDNLITNSFNQLIITNDNFIILGGGNQHIKIAKNEYFFNVLSNLNIAYPKDEIRIFSRSSEKTFKFTTFQNDKSFEIVISKVFNDTNIFEHYVIIIEDITEKLLIEEQKETFIATLTHDLKTPIRAEQNILKQLLNEKFGSLNTEQKTILQEILNSRAYENRMLENLLTRYKMTLNSFKLQLETNNYKNDLETIIKEIYYLVENKKQSITLNYKAKTDEFKYDKTEIKRVIINIIQNATEHTPQNGKITITVNETENEIYTKISDNGYGIKKEDLKHIFDKNVTLAKKYRKVGAGLGLYICKTLIQAHKGKIDVKSQLNKGTTFIFSLPKTTN